MVKLDYNDDNVGGVARMYAIPLSCFSRVLHKETLNKNYLVLSSREGIIEFLVDEGFEVSEIETNSDDGIGYAVTITGFVSKIDKTKAKVLDTLANGTWLFAYQDANGVMWLSGTYEVPMLFSWQRSTGKSPSERSSGTFTAEATEKEPSIIIEDCFL